MRNPACLSAAGLVLAACSISTEPATFNGYAADARAIETDLIADGHYFATPRAGIPTSGTATYQGVIGFDAARSDVVRESYAGQMNVTARFDGFPGDMVTGRADNFVDSADRPLDGRLAVTFGNIDRNADPAFSDHVLMNLDGTLTDHRGTALGVAVEADGIFLGPSVQAIDGTVNGSMTSIYGVETLTGDYILAR